MPTYVSPDLVSNTHVYITSGKIFEVNVNMTVNTLWLHLITFIKEVGLAQLVGVFIIKD